jgi:hypothetical protein
MTAHFARMVFVLLKIMRIFALGFIVMMLSFGVRVDRAEKDRTIPELAAAGIAALKEGKVSVSRVYTKSGW